MDTITSIHRHIAKTTLRLDDLVHQAGRASAPAPELLETSLTELSSALEELRVSEEELRSQRDDLDASREALRVEVERWQELFRLAPDPCLVTDLDGTICEANHSAAQLLGVREEVLPGKPLAVFVAEDDRRELLRQLPWIAEAQRLTAWELRLRPRSGGTVPVELSVAAMRDRSGAPTGFQWIARDVSHRVREGGPFSPERPAEAGAGEPAPEHPFQDDAGAADWRLSFLAEAARAVGPETPAAVETLAGLLRESVVGALYLGHLREGSRLPGIRELARSTRLNHKVVSRVYRMLEAEGIMEVRDRSGAYVARQQWMDGELQGETARWLAEVLTDAWERRIEIPHLPELIRRWTASVPVRCACVESSVDRRAVLCRELRDKFGLDVIPVSLEPDAGEPVGLTEAVQEAEMVVTTPFHAGRVRTLARALGKPLLVASLAGGKGAMVLRSADGAEARERTTPMLTPPLSTETARGIVSAMVRINLDAGGQGGGTPGEDRRLA